jgi:hypothetical protein
VYTFFGTICILMLLYLHFTLELRLASAPLKIFVFALCIETSQPCHASNTCHQQAGHLTVRISKHNLFPNPSQKSVTVVILKLDTAVGEKN